MSGVDGSPPLPRIGFLTLAYGGSGFVAAQLAVALLLAGTYQHTDQPQKAIELLESLGTAAPDEPAFALSLGELYVQDAAWDDVVRVTDSVHKNVDDVSLNILALRASALHELGSRGRARPHEGVPSAPATLECPRFYAVCETALADCPTCGSVSCGCPRAAVVARGLDTIPDVAAAIGSLGGSTSMPTGRRMPWNDC